VSKGFDPTNFNPNDDEWLGGGLPSNGAHAVRVTQAKCEVASTGNNMIVIDFEVVGVNDDDRGKMVKWQNYTLTEKSAWRLAELCRAIDPGMDSFDPTNQQEIDSRILGECLVIQTETYDDEWLGVTRQKINIKGHRPLTQAQRQNLADAGKKPTEKNSTTYDDDDVPF